MLCKSLQVPFPSRAATPEPGRPGTQPGPWQDGVPGVVREASEPDSQPPATAARGPHGYLGDKSAPDWVAFLGVFVVVGLAVLASYAFVRL